MSRRSIERNIAYDDARDMYYVTFHYGIGEDGKQIKTVKTFKTKTEARRALREHESARDRGSMTMPTSETFGEWLDYWMNTIIRPGREETTFYAYRQIIENHIKPVLGQIKLQGLSPQHLQSYYVRIAAEKGLSTNTVRKHHDLIKASLRMAVMQDKISVNPADRVELPKIVRPEHNYYGTAELQQLLRLDMEGWLRVAIYLACYLGLRREEICGLRWDCVDFENHTIRIKYARTSAGSKVVEKAPKNTSSERLLFCPPPLEAVLLFEVAQQQQNQVIYGEEYYNGGYVVAWPNGTPIRPNYVSDRFTNLIQSNHLPPLTLHGLRHTFASLANAQGVSQFDIGKALGHSTPSTTGKIYTHLFDPTHENTVSSVSDAIKIPNMDKN